jgi:hypothetical protein
VEVGASAREVLYNNAIQLQKCINFQNDANIIKYSYLPGSGCRVQAPRYVYNYIVSYSNATGETQKKPGMVTL